MFEIDDVQTTKACFKCKVRKSLDCFGNGIRKTYCDECRREYGRIWYKAKNREWVKKKIEYNNAFRQPNIEYVSNYLKNHPCVDCGESDPIVLEFDHRNPKEKLRDIARLKRSVPLEILKKEITKCDVRCANCHRRKTYRDFYSKSKG